MTADAGRPERRRAVRFGQRPFGGSRGQTLQDFTVGILLFVLTVSLTLATILGFVNPYLSGVGSDEVAQSARIGETLVTEYSTGTDPLELDADRLKSDVFTESQADLRNRWGLGRATNMYISIEPVQGSSPVVYGGTTFAVGDENDDVETARETRIVTLTDASCSPACRLVVEVW